MPSRTVALLALLALLAACGSDEAAAPDAPSEAMSGMPSEASSSGGMSMSAMDMTGISPDQTPADEIEGAELTEGDFVQLDTAPSSYGDVSGTAAMARTDDETVATLRLQGVPPDTEFLAHVHQQPCAEDQGGPHFRYDPDGPPMPPNEIHLPFTSAADGTGLQTAVSMRVAPPEAQAVVVHPAETPDNRVACADLS